MSEKASGSYPSLTKVINLLLLCIGGASIAYNVGRAIFKKYDPLYIITHPSIYVVAAGWLLLVVGHFGGEGLRKFLHISILIILSVVSIFSDYNSFYGLGQVVLLVLLLYKYGFLDRHIRAKLIILALFFIALIEVALFNSDFSGLGMEVLFFVAYFIAFLYIIYKDQIDEIMADRDRNHSLDISRLERQKARLIGQMEKYRLQLKEVEESIKSRKAVKVDWRRFKLTKTERRIIAILVRRNASNRQIAEHLEITERTVKTHFYNKIGIDSRMHLKDMFHFLIEDNSDPEWRE